MGDFDSFCAICGGQPDVASSEFDADLIENIFPDTSAEGDVAPISQTRHKDEWPADVKLPVEHQNFVKFIYDEKDLKFQKDMTLIGPFEEDGTLTIQDIFNLDRDELLSISTEKVKVEHECTVSGYGDVQKNSRGQYGFAGVGDSRTYMTAHETCYHLVKSFSRFTEATLWDTFRRASIAAFEQRPTLFNGVDYLEISESHEQFVWPWFGLHGPGVEREFRALSRARNPETLLRRLLLITGKCWVFVAPDRFPIKLALDHRLSSFPSRNATSQPSNTLSTLPVELIERITSYMETRDLLSLLATANTIRTSLLSTLDKQAKLNVNLHYPFFRPFGEKETSTWNSELVTAGGDESTFPWFVYRWMCEEHSPSMLNRRRICRILKQIEILAEENGVELDSRLD